VHSQSGNKLRPESLYRVGQQTPKLADGHRRDAASNKASYKEDRHGERQPAYDFD
jgi:hypothetical protein